jgi:hypothetical protein
MGMVRRSAPIVAGAVVLALLVYHVGWVAIASVGPWFAVVAAIDLVAIALDAGAIASLVEPHAGYGRAFVAQAVGFAVNSLTPGNSLGEPLKVGVLAAEAPRAAAVSAIVLYNVVTMTAGIVVVAIGAPLAIASFDLPRGFELALWLCTAALIAGAIAIVAIVRRNPLTGLVAIARRVRAISPARAEAWRGRAAAIDAELRCFGDARSRRALAFGFASRGCHALGTLVLLRAAGTATTGPVVLGVISLGIPIAWLSSLVPFGIGIADGGHAALYSALGASSQAGLGFATLDRARTCLASVIGLAIAGLAGVRLRAGASATA